MVNVEKNGRNFKVETSNQGIIKQINHSISLVGVHVKVKEVRLLAYFASIQKIFVSETMSGEIKRYHVRLVLNNDPDGGQTIIFTFDTKMLADTVAHTLDGYCNFANADESSTRNSSLLVCGCPFMQKKTGNTPGIGRIVANKDPTLIRSSITLERVLGEGQFGDVYKGAYRPPETNSSAIPVAVKACKIGLSIEEKQTCLEEADLHGKLLHPHIIKMYGVCRDEPVWLVLEFADEGELRHYLMERQDRIPIAVLVTYCHQLSSALAYLEAIRIIHRDVAARNVLVASESCVKLADFGMAHELEDRDFYVAEQGRKVPIKWMAPESLHSRIFSSASDVWMFGVCMWEILSFGLKPFANLSNADAVDHIASGQRLGRPGPCVPSLYRLMLECWMNDPVLRPTFTSLQPKLREILAEVKRLSAEKQDPQLSLITVDSGGMREKEALGIPPLRQTNLSLENSAKLSITSSENKNVSVFCKGIESIDPVYEAVAQVMESIQNITRQRIVPHPKVLVRSVQTVGALIREVFVTIQNSVDSKDDLRSVDAAERQLNDSFRFLIDDVTAFRTCFSNYLFRGELYERFLNQAYDVAASSRAVYQSVQKHILKS